MQHSSKNDLKHKTRLGVSLHDTVRRVRGVVHKPAKTSTPRHSTSLLSKRYELKYRIPESTACAVKSFVQGYLDVDKYARKHPGFQYPICSLYLDSLRFHLFHETICDKLNRFKLRIRGYDDDPNSPLFFEIKRKLNRVIYKSRAQIHKSDLAAVLNEYHVPRNLYEKDRKTLKQIMHYCQCLQARPIVLVRYMREAYENQDDSRVRVTFDRQLCSKYVREPIYTMNGTGWNRAPIDFVILEIKFTTNFPSWLTDMVRLFELNRQSMSKYCVSVRQLVPQGSTIYRIPDR